MSLSVFAQRGADPNTGFVESELHVFKTSDNYRGYFLYKIPYNRLVFLNKSDIFNAAFKVSVEIQELKSGSIIRDFREHSASVEDYQFTSLPGQYIQGIIEFNISDGEYVLAPVFSDVNSNREFISSPISFNTDSLNTSIGNPIIINTEMQNCNDDQFIIPANYSSSIPFSSESYSVLIPVYDDEINSLEVRMINDAGNDSLYSEIIDETIITSIRMSLCDGRIVINNKNNDEQLRFFVVRDISRNLSEGLYKLIIKSASNDDINREFKIPVKWINKPRSLFDPVKSLEYLLLIENEEIISELKGASRDKLSYSLFNFWKKYDPTPETQFNELMQEFYSRIDYAELNFRALSNTNGARSDRGKIYVQFGKPENVDRFTDENGRMMEQWKYVNPTNTFVFIDKKGTGNFTLLSNQ